MPIGATIGALGAVGSIGSGWLQSSAAKKASAQQVALGQQALAQQQQIFNTELGAANPLISLGEGASSGALSTLQKLLTPGANMTDTLSQIPGFKFAQDWGQKAVQNIGTTTGLGGNTLKAGADYATGVAQQGFGSIVNPLMSLFQSGGNIATGALSSLTSAGNNASGNIGQTLTGIGSSMAAGTLGSANALAGALGGAGGNIGNAFILSKLLGGGGGGGGGLYGGGKLGD
jgi:hypothetical protein